VSEGGEGRNHVRPPHDRNRKCPSTASHPPSLPRSLPPSLPPSQVEAGNIISVHDVSNTFRVPLLLRNQGLHLSGTPPPPSFLPSLPPSLPSGPPSSCVCDQGLHLRGTSLPPSLPPYQLLLPLILTSLPSSLPPFPL